MKKIFIVLLIAFVPFLGFAQLSDVDVYTFIYNGMQSLEEQYSLLQVMNSQDLTGAGDFYASALHRLVTNYQNIRTSGTSTDRDFADKQASLLAGKLGEEKQASAAADLWRVVDSFPNSLIRADALMALGRIRAVEFLPQVAKLLTDLNNTNTSDRLSGERLALGAIVSLEKYGDMAGYLPLYFAYQGWYADRVKSQALKSMEVISPDPTEPMIQILRSTTYSFQQKLAALDIVANSTNAPADNKAKAAFAALDEGWRITVSEVRQQEQLKMLRKNAMALIRSAGASEDAVYQLLERSYLQYAIINTRYPPDQDECTQAIITLRTLATEESAKRLAKFVMDLNAKRQAGTITTKDEGLIRELLPALGATKQAAARSALNAVIALGWTEAVKTLARDALKQIP